MQEATKVATKEPGAGVELKHDYRVDPWGRVAEFSECGLKKYDGRPLSVEMPLDLCAKCWELAMRRSM